MTFSTNPNPVIKQTWWQKFISQPHQLFFASAIFFAFVIMILTFISLLGKINLGFSVVHGFGLNYALFTNAFLGFLITVIPKYTNSLVIKSKYYLIGWMIFQVGIFITLLGFILIGKFIVSIVMFYFWKIFKDTIKKGNAVNKKDSIYINLIFFIGASFLLLESILNQNFSILIFFGFLISMVFTVAQRMIPAFYSSYTRYPSWNKPKYLLEVSTVLFLALGISLEFDFILSLKIVSFIAMLFFGYIVINLNIYKKTPPILSILVLSFIWLEIGFIFLFIESIFEMVSLKLAIHIFALGFVLNLLIGFGSRVMLGHAVPSQRIEADKITVFLFILTQIVIITRIFASGLFLINSPAFLGFLHLSISLWILLFLIWSLRYGKILFRI